jgi:alkanesulfonate monooxygenase SsuD/methylene tetrahydromethanopterin reductase-like flavin-dependent oxidoreductase (luciferase family)
MMRFGVFDHMDRNGPNLGQQYRDRLQLIEAYDRAGFYAYHLAEHHGTPLGLASSPGVFLAAVSQRTSSLRFGPLVYTLSIYHPLRVIEEICMLDQLSGGRLELGIGRGVSPIEMGFYGVGDEAQEIYQEVSAIVLQGLGQDHLDYQGKHFQFKNVPLELRPVQRPRPPLWYGVARPDTTVWAAANRMNIVTNGPASTVRTVVDRYREEWAQTPHASEPLPKLGMSRHVVVGQTDREALESATRAYKRWFDSLLHLWRIHNIPIPLNFPENFADARAAGLCVVGSAATVRDTLARDIETAGVNYLLCRIAFGDLPMEESLQTVALLQHEIMPAFTVGRFAAIAA